MAQQNDMPKNNSDNILIELIKNQKKTIVPDKKLLYNDLKRISKYLNNSIFTDECSLWTGYITIIKNDDKNSYINFYYNGKKYALHRLLYNNFIGELSDSEYIKFKCPNKGKCCNISHFYKINKNEDENTDERKSFELPNNTPSTSSSHDSNKKDIKPIIVDFNI